MQDDNETVFEAEGTKLIFHPTHHPFTSQIALATRKETWPATSLSLTDQRRSLQA